MTHQDLLDSNYNILVGKHKDLIKKIAQKEIELLLAKAALGENCLILTNNYNKSLREIEALTFSFTYNSVNNYMKLAKEIKARTHVRLRKMLGGDDRG